MRHPSLVLILALAFLPGLRPGVGGVALSQVADPTKTPPQLLLIRLVRPDYPPIALQAGITGDVTVEIMIRGDGTVGSAEVVSGRAIEPPEPALYRDSSLAADTRMYPLLSQAALDSARQLRFRCQCGNREWPYRVTYTFTIFPEKYDPCCCTSKKEDPSNPPPEAFPSTLTSAGVPHLSDMQITVRAKQACICPDRCPSEMKYLEEHARFRAAKCLYLWKCGHRTVILE